MGYLDAYYDPGLEVDLGLTPEDITACQVARLANGVAVAHVAIQIPRRLSDATREELALDKKRGRRVHHALHQSLVSWGGGTVELTDEHRRLGAQVDWKRWCEEWESDLLGHLRQVTTWAKQTGQLRFGKSAVVKLTQERSWIEYALRD